MFINGQPGSGKSKRSSVEMVDDRSARGWEAKRSFIVCPANESAEFGTRIRGIVTKELLYKYPVAGTFQPLEGGQVHSFQVSVYAQYCRQCDTHTASLAAHGPRGKVGRRPVGLIK